MCVLEWGCGKMEDGVKVGRYHVLKDRSECEMYRSLGGKSWDSKNGFMPRRFQCEGLEGEL